MRSPLNTVQVAPSRRETAKWLFAATRELEKKGPKRPWDWELPQADSKPIDPV